MRLSEAEVGALPRREPPSDVVKDPKVDLRPSRARVSALARVKGRWVYVEAEGRLSLPGFVRKGIGRRLKEVRLSLPATAGSLEVEEALALKKGGRSALRGPGGGPAASDPDESPNNDIGRPMPASVNPRRTHQGGQPEP